MGLYAEWREAVRVGELIKKMYSHIAVVQDGCEHLKDSSRLLFLNSNIM